MNVLVLGGSGLLGTHVVREALAEGHTVTALARTPTPTDEAVRWVRADLATLVDPQLQEAFSGQEAVVYALGLDDRWPHPRPAYPVFFDDHVTCCLKALRAAKAAGARKFVVLGSYFTHFERTHPEWKLADHHPYIRSRCAQRDAVLAEAGPGFDTYVLELPYILGTLPGKVPPWAFLFSMLSGPGGLAFFFGRGGTAAVTARQVARASVSAIGTSAPSGAYALGGVNWSWPELAQRFFAISGMRHTLIPLPSSLFVAFGAISGWVLRLRGRERGLHVARFAELQYSDAFVDPAASQSALGYTHDDYDGTLAELIHAWRALRRPGGPPALLRAD